MLSSESKGGCSASDNKCVARFKEQKQGMLNLYRRGLAKLGSYFGKRAIKGRRRDINKLKKKGIAIPLIFHSV